MSLFGLNMSKTFLCAACRAFYLLILAREQKSLATPAIFVSQCYGNGYFFENIVTNNNREKFC
jgi:hypothetical protein